MKSTQANAFIGCLEAQNAQDKKGWSAADQTNEDSRFTKNGVKQAG